MSPTPPDSAVRQSEAAPGTARARQWLNRAVTAAGHERYTLELVGKSTLAATASWFVAHDLLAARSPAFAPFSAVLMMQVTVYQSLAQSLRYVAAACAGVAIQGALGLLAGPDLLTFALVTLIAMVIGRWQPLGTQGGQVPTAAFFAFSTYVSATGTLPRLEQLGQIIGLVVIGCGIGVLVNITLLPPMRYRGAERSIHTLAQALGARLDDIQRTLREGPPDEELSRRWRQQAAALVPIVTQARSALHTAEESHHYNPRRLLPRHRHRDFSGYEELVNALERVTHQVTSMTRALHQWPREEHTETDKADEADEDTANLRPFLREYAALLRALTRITELFASLDENHLTTQAKQLCQAAEAAQEKREALDDHSRHTSLPLSDPSRPYGILLAEATRLMAEAQHACDVLQHSVHRAERSGELDHPRHSG
ncbi:aromatic acid exporter family protein [Streptomyces sp. NPDC005438]|uniref:FUSC family protein n=1 Tax=Streptomyces sp. NPDC005438 TaxID=3156880 RepID=UPI0033B79461